MNESEKRQMDVGPGFIRARECPDCGHTRCSEDCVCNCDAARAEHEAARLRVEVDRLKAQVSAARDAALEEAVVKLTGHRDGANAIGLTGRGLVFHDAAESIRALQTQPVQVVSMEQVRKELSEVLAARAQDLAHGLGVKDAVLAIAYRLGVDLDATKEPTR